jgi:hypothetical protein
MANSMSENTPEAVLQFLLLRARKMPDLPRGEARNSPETKRKLQDWFDGRLAEDFDYSDLTLIAADGSDASKVPPAAIINDDAYIYRDAMLHALIREADGAWRLRISLSMCWGCFGDHSYSGGPCRGVLCECCGGTGRECGDLEFCVVDELSIDPALSSQTVSPQEAFLHLVNARIPEIRPMERGSVRTISPALIRGDVAKLEIANPDTRYIALMREDTVGRWVLSAFLPLCVSCGGRGRMSKTNDAPCSECGGLKWGSAGQLRYCRNNAPGSWWMEHHNWITIKSDDPRDIFNP